MNWCKYWSGWWRSEPKAEYEFYKRSLYTGKIYTHGSFTYADDIPLVDIQRVRVIQPMLKAGWKIRRKV